MVCDSESSSLVQGINMLSHYETSSFYSAYFVILGMVNCARGQGPILSLVLKTTIFRNINTSIFGHTLVALDVTLNLIYFRNFIIFQ